MKKPNSVKKGVRTRKIVKLSKVEKALIALAVEIEYLPHCETRVRQKILDILQLEFIPQTRPKASVVKKK
jgi:cell division protein FtsL